MQKLTGFFLVVFAILSVSSCNQNPANTNNSEKWITSEPLFLARNGNGFSNMAVKDPSIVKYNGKYHLFYTSKTADTIDGELKYKTGTGYTSAETLEGLNSSKRYNIETIVDGNVVAPQIFYFEPHKVWYLIAHTWVNGNHGDLEPIYMTNPDIEYVLGWSKMRVMDTHKRKKEFWIDFWVIANDKDIYMFYANQKGSLMYMKSPISEFPNGFRKSKSKIALTQTGVKDSLNWKMFEAAHVFYAQKDKKYIALCEGAYLHPVNSWEVDARSRFIFAMTADSLDGEWTRLEVEKNIFFADAKDIYNEDGSKSANSLVSHPELIRDGNNQKMEIESIDDIKILYQSFDASNIPATYNYNELPWNLSLMQKRK